MRIDPMGNCCAVGYLFGFANWNLLEFKKKYVERCIGYRRNVLWIGRQGKYGNSDKIAEDLKPYGTVNISEGKSYGTDLLNVYYFSPTNPPELRKQFAKDIAEAAKTPATSWK